MAEQSEAQEKTIDPTPKRLQDAKEEGQILTSKELFVFTSAMSGFLCILLFLFLSDMIFGGWIKMFDWGAYVSSSADLYSKIQSTFEFVLMNVLIVALPLLVITLATQFMLGQGLNFSTKALSFKGNRIDPVQGFKRMFSIKSLVEMGKAVLKVILLVSVAALVIYYEMETVSNTIYLSHWEAISVVFWIFLKALGALSIVLLAIAILDVIWQRHQWLKQLKMTPQELKDESKQTEGSPEVRARIRQMQREVVQRAQEQRAALENIPEATAIITNPTHFAVAIKYELGTSSAPTIVAMGKGQIALEIIDRGNKADVYVLESPILARALYFTGQIGKEIAEELYTAVATVLAFIYRIGRGEKIDEPELEIPQNMLFDENGKTADG